MHIVFFSTSNVFRAEEILIDAKIECKVVPTPVTDKAKIQEYLDGCGACSGCMDAFEEAWAEYERERSRTEACKSS